MLAFCRGVTTEGLRFRPVLVLLALLSFAIPSSGPCEVLVAHPVP